MMVSSEFLELILQFRKISASYNSRNVVGCGCLIIWVCLKEKPWGIPWRLDAKCLSSASSNLIKITAQKFSSEFYFGICLNIIQLSRSCMDALPRWRLRSTQDNRVLNFRDTLIIDFFTSQSITTLACTVCWGLQFSNSSISSLADGYAPIDGADQLEISNLVIHGILFRNLVKIFRLVVFEYNNDWDNVSG